MIDGLNLAFLERILLIIIKTCDKFAWNLTINIHDVIWYRNKIACKLLSDKISSFLLSTERRSSRDNVTLNKNKN